MMKAVTYYRVSSPGQGRSGLGLEAQQKAVRDFVKRNKYKLINQYTEIESGRGTANRPFLLQAIEECRKKNAILLIATLDRLARNVAFIATLMESKIPFKAVDFPDADEFQLHIRAAFAEQESKAISKRTIAALQAAKARGVKLGTYAKTLAEKRRKKYQRFAKKMKPVIHKMYDEGFTTIRQIMDELNERHIEPFTGSKAHWHVSTVHKLLKHIEQLD